MSAREAQKHIQGTYMLRLADAPFASADATLLPEVGACGPCPFRTGNQAELFGDVKGADVCTSPTCFHAKVEAHNARALERAKATGQTVISGAAAKKVAPHGPRAMNGYVALAEQNWDDPKRRSYKQILGKGYVPTLLLDEKAGRLIEIAPKADLPQAAKQGPTNDYRAQQKAEQRKRDLELQYRAALFLAARSARGARPLARAELEQVAERLLRVLDHDAKKRLFKVLEWPVDKSKMHGGVDLKLPTPVADLSDDDLAQLIRDLSMANELVTFSFSSSKPEALERAAADLKLDAKAIRAGLAADARSKARGTRRAQSMKAKAAARAKASKR